MAAAEIKAKVEVMAVAKVVVAVEAGAMKAGARMEVAAVVKVMGRAEAAVAAVAVVKARAGELSCMLQLWAMVYPTYHDISHGTMMCRGSRVTWAVELRS
jgi:hypothetical protein